MSSMQTPVILWFRRDLRLTDNKALETALHTGAPIIPLFIFDPALLKSDRVGSPRMKFMLAALRGLDESLRAYGGRLLIRHGEPHAALRGLIHQTGAAAVYFNVDYTPYARERDEALADALDVSLHSFDDRLLVPPGDLLKDDGTPYVVFTPFKKRWRNLPHKPEQAEYSLNSDALYDLSGLESAPVPEPDELGFSHQIALDIPDARESAAHSLLDRWLSRGIYHYDDARDTLGNPKGPPRAGTSFLSPYIRFGVIATRTIYWACRDAYARAETDAARESVVSFVDELIWHEFYTHILWHFPHVVHRNFQSKYDAVQWRHAPDHLAAWQDGMTGYPVVDAAMRQLKGIGWMHNRARMIVSSFLTKDLLIDWREGERHFMQWLLDGDTAANNGGWQWAAGSGTDAQPYFRIFNPVSQGKKFDPDGRFIRHWVPELRDVPDKHIHEPWKATTPPANYPAPMVDHKAARAAALEAYRVVKGN